MTRQTRKTTLLAVLLIAAFCVGVLTAPPRAEAISLGGGLGTLIKLFGIAWVVNHFAGDINKAINTALAQKNAEIQGYTKVVPIVRLIGSEGKAVGAAQVMGPKAQVEKVKAVAEVDLKIGGSVRARGLVPISTRNTLSTVPGVGVSANIKFPL